MAFNKLNKYGNGQIDIDDINNFYDATEHPDILLGKKNVEEVLTEFLETFACHHDE